MQQFGLSEKEVSQIQQEMKKKKSISQEGWKKEQHNP